MLNLYRIYELSKIDIPYVAFWVWIVLKHDYNKIILVNYNPTNLIKLLNLNRLILCYVHVEFVGRVKNCQL
jgi:hypothetical protein